MQAMIQKRHVGENQINATNVTIPLMRHAHMKVHRGEKSNKYSQCEYTSSLASALGMRIKIHNDKRSQNTINVAMALVMQAF